MTEDWIFVPNRTQTISEPDTTYLTGGVWLVVPDDESDAAGYSFGVFATGSDPFGHGRLMALRGSATRRGPVVGLYAVKSAEPSAHRRWKTGGLISSLFPLSKGKKHWFAVLREGDETVFQLQSCCLVGECVRSITVTFARRPANPRPPVTEF